MAQTRIRRTMMVLLILAHLIWLTRAQGGILAVLSSNSFGPFGPWSAPEVLLGKRGSGEWSLAFYPNTRVYGSRFYSATSGGSYKPADSETATLNSTMRNTYRLSSIDDTRGEVQTYYDQVKFTALYSRLDNYDYVETPPVNISMQIIDRIVYYGKYQGTRETPQPVNTIGFGHGFYPELDPTKVDHGFELLHELKARQTIRSKSFGFHLGIPGHWDLGAGVLTLGGYDRSRVVGQPAIFNSQIHTDPEIFLVDIVVGVQLGDSPFELIDHPTSFLDSNTRDSLSRVGLIGKAGSLLVRIDPQKPHMGLPAATCNSLARHLPVTWDSSLDLYVWNTADPAFGRITQSSAYLAVVLSDRTAKRVSIKIPFRILALRFEPTSPNQKIVTYLPCESVGSSGFYLGRAFLQAAFWGVDFEQHLMYIAQAPGPTKGQTVLLPFPANGSGFEAEDYATFEQTWAGHWTPFDKSTIAKPGPFGLSTGAIVGIAIGIMCAILLPFALRIVAHWRRRNASRGAKEGPNPESSPLMAGSSYSDLEAMPEMDPQVASHEISHPLAHELSADCVPCELPARSRTPVSRRRSI